MAQVIVCAGAATADFHRQTWLSSIQSLNLALFIHTQYQRSIWRIEIKANHIGQLFHKPFVARELEGSLQMRLQPMQIP